MNCNLLENNCGCMVVALCNQSLLHKGITANSLENFHTYQSIRKSTTSFYLKQFAIYGIRPQFLWQKYPPMQRQSKLVGGGYRHWPLFPMPMNKCNDDSRSTQNLLTRSGLIMQVLAQTMHQVIWISKTRVYATHLTAIEVEMLWHLVTLSNTIKTQHTVC